tara:strand:+ start:1314 stop:1889 length:576 start_codon:yes stop_codon:yes gene_type:complete
MRNLFPLVLCITLFACGESNHPKSYYKENNSARIENLIWCDDNSAEASGGNCINALGAYRELRSDIKDERSIVAQKLLDEQKTDLEKLKVEYGLKREKLSVASRTCIDQQREDQLAANKSCFSLRTAIERNACIKTVSKTVLPSCFAESQALETQYRAAQDQVRDKNKTAFDELDAQINKKIEALKVETLK